MAGYAQTSPWSRWWSPVPRAGHRYGFLRRAAASAAADVSLLPVLVPSNAITSDAVFTLALVYGACYVALPHMMFAELRFPVKLAFVAVAVAIGWVLVLEGRKIYVLIYVRTG